MTQDHADEPERDDRHDDERFRVRTQGNGQQREDQEQRDRESAIKTAQGVELLLLFPSEPVREFRVLGDEARQDGVLQNVVGGRGGNHAGIHVGAHRDHALAVLAPDGGRRGARTQRGHPADRHVGAGRRAEPVTLDVGNRVALLLG